MVGPISDDMYLRKRTFGKLIDERQELAPHAVEHLREAFKSSRKLLVEHEGPEG